MNDTRKFLIAGVGDLARRTQPTWESYEKQGVQLLAMDITDEPSGLTYLPKGTPFFNTQYPDQRRALLKLEPFHVCLLANYPSAHLATALQFDFFTERFIFTKPIDSHIQLLKTVREGRKRNFEGIVSKMLIHDHYRNKPLVARFKSLLPTLHGRYGFIREIKIYITERRSTQAEWRRKGALDDGLILDLAPHALSVLMELLPKKLRWKSQEGHVYERTDISFDTVTGCYRARDNFCILRDGAESFGVIDLHGIENIEFYPIYDDNHTVPLQPRHFRILIVVGKGTSIDNATNGQDLKAIQITFDGNDIIGNFDTNAIGGVIEEDLVSQLTVNVDPRHRGLNLPFQRLGEANFDFDALNSDAEDAVADFQNFDEAYEVIAILSQALQHESAKTIVAHYIPGVPSSDLINRLIAKGLDSRWQHSGPLSHLVFGRSPEDAID